MANYIENHIILDRWNLFVEIYLSYKMSSNIEIADHLIFYH